MNTDNPTINTGHGKMLASEAMRYFRSETERTPTTTEPRDTSVLLGILRALPKMLQKHAAFSVISDYKARPHLFEFERAQTLVREARMIAYTRFNEEPGEWIIFGDLSRSELGHQCQYGSRYVDGVIDGYPNLGEGLRFEGEAHNYQLLRMHVDDIPIFLQRYSEHRENQLRR